MFSGAFWADCFVIRGYGGRRFLLVEMADEVWWKTEEERAILRWREERDEDRDQNEHCV